MNAGEEAATLARLESLSADELDAQIALLEAYDAVLQEDLAGVRWAMGIWRALDERQPPTGRA